MNNKRQNSKKYFLNPILSGDWPDPSLIKVDDRYYLTHSTNVYTPALLIWCSEDLVNWKMVCRAIDEFKGDVWAPEFVEYNRKYYIYFQSIDTNWVICADNPEGPWGEPIDLKISGCIDPGHAVDVLTDQRYLFFSGGGRVALSQDGLTVQGEVEHVFDAWPMPEEWDVEGVCLESPKVIYKDGWYILTLAQGGTAGPPTSHCVIVARSRSLDGPFEFAPNNPILHTNNASEDFWSVGHGTVFEDSLGEWWIIYHGYLNGSHSYGRCTFLQHIVWTDNGWYEIPSDIKNNKPIYNELLNEGQKSIELNDKFYSESLGLQWSFYKRSVTDIHKATINGLELCSQGNIPGNSTMMTCIPIHKNFVAEVDISIYGYSEGGICLFYNSANLVGLGFNKDMVFAFKNANKSVRKMHQQIEKMRLRLIHKDNVTSMYYSYDGVNFEKARTSYETSAINHNLLGGFLSLRIGIYSMGSGYSRLENFTYNYVKPSISHMP